MSRNQKTMMIGGALVLIAMLLVCGPLLVDRFGEPAGVAEPPPVAAGPPAGVGVAGAGVAGAITGAGVGESEFAASGSSVGAGDAGTNGAYGLADESERCRRLEDETDEQWRRRLEQIENEGGLDEDCVRWAAGSGYAGIAGAAGAGASGLAGALAESAGNGESAARAAAGSAADAANNLANNAADKVADTGNAILGDAESMASDGLDRVTRGAAAVAGTGAGVASGVAAGIASGSSAGSGAVTSGVGIGATTTADLPLATIRGVAGEVSAPLAGPGSTLGSGLNGAGEIAAGIGSGLEVMDPGAVAAGTFDSQFASGVTGPGGGTPSPPVGGLGGPVVNRFAPPVAAPGAGGPNVAGIAQPFGQNGGFLQPCDSPGSGCRNLGAASAISIPVNPPIIPGGRPVPGGVPN